MKDLITKGSMTDHGGIIQEGTDRFIVDGLPVHLEGMTHYCPTCKTMSTAKSMKPSFTTVDGKNIIAVDDISSCGSRFVDSSQGRARREAGHKSNNSSSFLEALKSFINSPSKDAFDEQVATDFSFAEGMPYFIETKDGRIFKGVVGDDGKLPRVPTPNNEPYKLFLGEEAIEKGAE